MAGTSGPTLVGNYIGKFQIFKVYGAVNHTPEPIKVKFGREERPNFTLIGATCRPAGRKNEKSASE